MNAIIIDDELLARDIIRTYLKDFPKVNIIGECANGFEGVKMINELKPDLIFLDIQMPKITGFEMIELIVSVSNPYDPKTQPPKGKGIGLKNTEQRLKLLYELDHMMTITKTSELFSITLHIPQHS